ncbi:hypothetical protein BDW02DRAFT_598065 [Decorospora gaudefroyi]|uniref:FAD/NAD(P)-binding domain-containing protein n=1 Tax=Decorospora gaudefroyi TaxID=184978 RepID=A0A6A5K9J7_9PLEO|nr:hypothetical protein BDW02DRAFT_598065 [Decorospora gaudefroyi]
MADLSRPPVWRYLQEAGFGNAALQLARCWIRDPDTLPFATHIEPHALIRLVQDGLCFDQLQADACHTEPRYRFGRDHGRPFSARNGNLLTLDKGIPAHQLAAEANGALPDPPPKKTLKRKKGKTTNGVELRPEPEVNGDAMDIEHNGTTHVTNSVRAESETIPSEAESPTVAEIPISTLSIGNNAGFQTEVISIADLAPQTVFIPRHLDPGKVVEHTSWGPIDAPVLLAAGRSLLQVHVVSRQTTPEQTPTIRTGDMLLPVNNFDVTALCWHSDDELTVSVREQCFNEVGEKMMMDKLIKLTEGGQVSHIISSTAGLINTLRWNPDRNLLLSISTDGEKGSIKVWKNESDSIPAWTDFTDTAIFDAHWITDSAFVVCGIKLFKVYEVGESLTTQRTLDTSVTWETVKYDPTSGIIAVLGIEDQKGYLGILHPNDSISLQTHELPDDYPTDLDFRIRTSTNTLTNGSSVPSVLLVTCSMLGTVRAWDVNEPFKCVKLLTTSENTQALKIAFSPDGSLLAAAGPDAVTIWDIERRDVPVASWHAREWPSDKWNPSTEGEFSLGWDPDSSRLSIALGNQIAIIPVPRYLGCACDVPSHSYQYTFQPNPNWSSLYAPAPEIQSYLQDVAEKYSATRFIKLRHEIQACHWNDKTAKWHITVKNLATGETLQDQADVLISGRGNLNTPSWPEIDGIETFKGAKMHSATWDQSYDFENKRIGVIGSGSSSIQIVPSLQRLPGTQVSTFVRSKTWISPPFGQQLWDKYGFQTSAIPRELRDRFANDPDYYHKFRLSVEEDGNGIHAVTMKGTELQKGAKDMFHEHMREKLKSKPEIFEALLPSFSPGCRRLTPGPGYLEALTQPNVSFITSPIARMSESAIHTVDGRTHEIDALVCATGFKSSAPPPFPLTGSNGLPLTRKWENRAVTYLSHSVAGFPNLFTMLGPNAAIGSGSLTTMIETVGDYIIKAIRKIQKENIASMVVKEERERDFIEYVDAYFEGTVFADECRSWYKNKGTGEVVGLWPGSTLHCVETMRSPRWEDFEYIYVDELEGTDESRLKGVGKNTNRLAWLGNGWTVKQQEEKDLAWYLYPEFVNKPVAPLPEENEEFKIRPFSY